MPERKQNYPLRYMRFGANLVTGMPNSWWSLSPEKGRHRGEEAGAVPLDPLQPALRTHT